MVMSDVLDPVFRARQRIAFVYAFAFANAFVFTGASSPAGRPWALKKNFPPASAATRPASR
jgi:hypothetical protein